MIDKIILTDNKFDIEIFNRNLEKLFMDIIDSIEKRDIDSIKNYVASDVYYKLNIMVNTYKEKNISRTFKNVNIESIDIESVDITDNFITIDTIVKVNFIDSFKDYITNNVYKMILTKRRGNDNYSEIDMRGYGYILTYIDNI
ncbi:MAG: TIM44-like domain-containing protein [Bacilli bacterium]|nr:TIM44-like domain-containing protein [Bacilli bacterium]